MKNKKIFNLDNLYIVTDFDHTLTTKESQNCWGILSTIPNISKKYIQQSHNNNKYYFPIEQSDHLNYAYKNKMMQQWYQKHADLLVKYHLQKQDIENISKSDKIILRKGVVEFLKYTNEHHIPVIIVSAGISNIINGILEKNNCFFDNVYVISNIFKFENGILKSLRNQIIHSLNKDIVNLPPKIKDIIKRKDEVIVIGDNISDSKITLKDNVKTFKIGFLNFENPQKLKSFKKNFDLVYNQTNSFEDIINLMDANLTIFRKQTK